MNWNYAALSLSALALLINLATIRLNRRTTRKLDETRYQIDKMLDELRDLDGQR